MDQKNIWYFHHYATPETMSGMSRPSSFGKHLQKAGHRITVFAASFMHYSGENLIAGRELYVTNHDTEVPFVFVRTRGYANSGKARMYNMIQFCINLQKTARRYAREDGRPDVIIASSPHPLTLLAGIRVAKHFGIPCICEIRDFWPEVFFFGGRLKKNSLLGRLLLAGERWIYRHADGLVFLKEGDVNYLHENGWDSDSPHGDIPLSKCHYINNGIDFDKFRGDIADCIFADPDLETPKFRIIYTGAIRPVNNIDNILDAAKLLRDYPDIEFLVYGNGNLVDAMKERIEREEIGNVKMKGAVPKKYIPYILSRSSVNLLNYSATEYNWNRGNSSNKLFEYMASGKPVISTVQMGYCIIRKYECGISVRECTPAGLAEAILTIRALSEAEYRRYCENALFGARQFDFGTLTEQLLKVIEQVSSKEKGKR